MVVKPLEGGTSFGLRVMRKIGRILRQVPIIPVIVLPVFVFCGLFGNIIAPHNPVTINLGQALTPPVWVEGGNRLYPLGTDELGRDILSRIVVGASIPLQVGIAVIFAGAFIGLTLAMLAGYMGGWVDTIIMRAADTMLAMPYMMIVIVLAAILEPSKYSIIFVLVIMGWATGTRVMRGEVLRIRESDFIKLAVVAGTSKPKIMLWHIFPNIFNTQIVLSTLALGSIIIMEAILSFLGVGVPPPHPAWGSMCAEGRGHLVSAWWISLWPGVAIFLVVLSWNLLGDWLRVRLDPKFRQL